MILNYKEQRGFSLLELLLVLVIISIIMYLGITRYFTYKREADIQIIQQNVNLLFNSLNDYYYSCCNSQIPRNFCTAEDNFVVNQQALQKEHLWPNLISTSIATPNDYSVAVNKIGSTLSGKDIYQVIVQLTLTNVSSASSHYYQTILGATSLLNTAGTSGFTLAWIRLPTYSIPKMSGHLWIQNTGLNYFKEFILQNDQTTPDTHCAY